MEREPNGRARGRHPRLSFAIKRVMVPGLHIFDQRHHGVLNGGKYNVEAFKFRSVVGQVPQTSASLTHSIVTS